MVCDEDKERYDLAKAFACASGVKVIKEGLFFRGCLFHSPFN